MKRVLFMLLAVLLVVPMLYGCAAYDRDRAVHTGMLSVEEPRGRTLPDSASDTGLEALANPGPAWLPWSTEYPYIDINRLRLSANISCWDPSQSAVYAFADGFMQFLKEWTVSQSIMAWAGGPERVMGDAVSSDRWEMNLVLELDEPHKSDKDLSKVIKVWFKAIEKYNQVTPDKCAIHPAQSQGS